MSYQVLARKWRPRNFSTLVGQEHVVRALTHALAEQRLHHAYLFTGTRGVGKTTIARILAKALNCETGITASPCGRCSACQEIDAGRFVDLLEVDAATNTRVDEMRQLLENAIYAPTRGRFKVYVIDEVHMLSTSAFNAMLKTLEEPPDHVKFILATTDPQKIPVTVLSRCLQFNLKQMSAASILTHLAHILQVEELPFEGGALALLARSAAGSMRDALSLLDQAIAHGAGRVEESQVRLMLGNLDQDHLFSVLEALHEGKPAVLLQVAATLAARSLSFANALQELAAILTRIQVLQCVPDSLDSETSEKERLRLLADLLPADYVQLAYQIVNLGRAELSLAPDEYAGFVMTLLRLHTFRPLGVAEQVAGARSMARAAIARPEVLTESESPRVTTARAVEIAVPRPPPVIDSAAAGALTAQSWCEVAAALPLTGLARELAVNCELREITTTLCLLRLPAGLAHLQMKSAQERLQQVLADYLKRSIQLKIEVGAPTVETPAVVAGKHRQLRQELAVEAIENDLFVQEAKSLLDASLSDSSIKPID